MVLVKQFLTAVLDQCLRLTSQIQIRDMALVDKSGHHSFSDKAIRDTVFRYVILNTFMSFFPLCN